MKQLSKKEINRLYGKDNKDRKKIKIPRNEPYKRQKISINDFDKIIEYKE